MNRRKEEETLVHYGVLGMKWGVGKDANRAYTKGSKKLRKLDTKLVKKSEKATKAQKKADKAWEKATSNKKAAKAEKLEVDYRKKTAQANKARDKAIKWYKKMEKVFDGVELSNVSEADVELGRAYAQMLFSEKRMRGGV